MTGTQANMSPPDGIPVLARGRHRSARRGACLMEYVSVLAGERFSDHPTSTHPAVARLARLVNDSSSDADRSLLGAIAPDLIALRTDDARQDRTIAVLVALHAASTALPIVAEYRKRPMAVTVLRCVERLDEELGTPRRVLDAAERALARTPRATSWARERLASGTFRGTARRAIDTDAMIALAVRGMAETCPPDLDGILRALLERVTSDVRAVLTPTSAAPATLAPPASDIASVEYPLGSGLTASAGA